MWTFGERSSSLRDFHHQSVEMLAFGRAVAANAGFTAKERRVSGMSDNGGCRVSTMTTSLLLHREA